MPAEILTKKDKKYIAVNRLTICGSDMAKQLGVSKSVINRYMRMNGLAVDKQTLKVFRSSKMVGKTTFSENEDQVIRENYLLLPVKVLAAKINRSYTGIMGRINAMGLEIPAELAESRKKIGQIKKGSISHNKGKKQIEFMTPEAIERTKATRFKKGNQPHNTKERNGTIVTRHNHLDRNEKPYKYIRVALGKWELLHRHIWRKKYGRIPKGMCVWFKDGDTMNVKLSNLELITRSENMKRNTIHNYPPEIAQAVQLRGALNRQINKHLKKLNNNEK